MYYNVGEWMKNEDGQLVAVFQVKGNPVMGLADENVSFTHEALDAHRIKLQAAFKQNMLQGDATILHHRMGRDIDLIAQTLDAYPKQNATVHSFPAAKDDEPALKVA